MKIFAIGATGFIGRHVVSQLLLSGHQVAVLHRGNTPLPPGWAVTEFLGTRADLPDIHHPWRAWTPDIAIDMILSSASQAQATVEAFVGVARRIVAISSGDVYRAMSVLHHLETCPVEPTPLTETSQLRTQSQTYSPEALATARLSLPWIDAEYDKIQVERAISSHPDLPATILRLPMVYGPGDMFHRLYPTVKRMLDARPAILLEQSFAQWVPCRGYVENVAHAIALAATSEQAAGQIFNVADPKPYTEAEWTTKIGHASRWNGRVIALPRDRMPPHLLTPYNFEQHLFMDSTHIRRHLGYSELVSIEEALRRTVEWEKTNPPDTIDAAQYDYAAEETASL
jgi:nucleoside-diphosphate-sugar epimerase